MLWWCCKKSQEICKVISGHPLGTMNVCINISWKFTLKLLTCIILDQLTDISISKATPACLTIQITDNSSNSCVHVGGQSITER